MFFLLFSENVYWWFVVNFSKIFLDISLDLMWFGFCFVVVVVLVLSRLWFGVLMLVLIWVMWDIVLWIGGGGLMGVCMSMWVWFFFDMYFILNIKKYWCFNNLGK